jgi:hypothetical protein
VSVAPNSPRVNRSDPEFSSETWVQEQRGEAAVGAVSAHENRQRYFRSTNALWNRNSLAGLRTTARLAILRRRTNRVISPSTNRSMLVRGGARRRERRLMRRCCLRSRDSAMTERTPPGRASWARVTINCTTRRSKSRIVKAGYQGHRSAQDCSLTTGYDMICGFAPHSVDFKSMRQLFQQFPSP